MKRYSALKKQKTENKNKNNMATKDMSSGSYISYITK